MTHFNKEELEVSQILLQLPVLISQSESLFYVFKVTWAAKRKRSKPFSALVNGKAAASSPPANPPCESNEKPKKNLKRKREDWLKIIDKLTEQRDLLKKEVENVMGFYNKAKAFNVELKSILEARKQEPMSSSLVQQPPPLIENQMANKNLLVPVCIPDLNLPAMEIGMMEADESYLEVANKLLTNAMAAQARKRRMEICRVRNSNAASRARCPIPT